METMLIVVDERVCWLREEGKGLVIWFVNCTRVYSHWKPSKIIVSTLHIFDDNKNIQPPALPFVIAPYFWSTFASAILIPKLIVDRITFCVVFSIALLRFSLFLVIMHIFWKTVTTPRWHSSNHSGIFLIRNYIQNSGSSSSSVSIFVYNFLLALIERSDLNKNVFSQK